MKIKDKKLLIVFISLLILVVCLGIRIYYLEKNKPKKKELVNIIVPLTKKDNENSFNINLENYKRNEEIIYKFKVTNYYKNKLNKKDIKYNIEIINNDDVDIKIYKNNKNYTLTNNLIEKEKLSKDKKSENIYTMKIKTKKNIKSSTILINIKKQ